MGGGEQYGALPAASTLLGSRSSTPSRTSDPCSSSSFEAVCDFRMLSLEMVKDEILSNFFREPVACVVSWCSLLFIGCCPTVSALGLPLDPSSPSLRVSAPVPFGLFTEEGEDIFGPVLRLDCTWGPFLYHCEKHFF